MTKRKVASFFEVKKGPHIFSEQAPLRVNPALERYNKNRFLKQLLHRLLFSWNPISNLQSIEYSDPCRNCRYRPVYSCLTDTCSKYTPIIITYLLRSHVSLDMFCFLWCHVIMRSFADPTQMIGCHSNRVSSIPLSATACR